MEQQIFEEGRKFMENGNLEDAITSFQDILLVNPIHTPSHLNLGLIYGLKGQINTAIESLKQAVEIDSKLLPGYLLLGQMYTRKKLPDQAKMAYAQVIEIQPDYAGGYTLLAQVYQKEGDLLKAVELYRLAVSMKQDSPEKKQAQVALEKLKKNARLIFNQGLNFFRQGAIDQAITFFEKVRILDPEHVQVLLELGIIHMGKGELEESVFVL
ncbi:MAG: tetratricopeptide repeat protein, partial [Nitrospirae bacterium]|nr:tetratricopeptide repeat protein [Candidatus Manganitrophaceae bacterium]